MIGAAGVDASAQTELDTLLQNMIAAQYQAVAKVSKATATRHPPPGISVICWKKAVWRNSRAAGAVLGIRSTGRFDSRGPSECLISLAPEARADLFAGKRAPTINFR